MVAVVEVRAAKTVQRAAAVPRHGGDKWRRRKTIGACIVVGGGTERTRLHRGGGPDLFRAFSQAARW